MTSRKFDIANTISFFTLPLLLVACFTLSYLTICIGPLAELGCFVFINVGFAAGQTVSKLKHQRESSIWM